MSATATTNGRPQRKQLSEQLDRMDSIIDALAEALPEAVADACREGARQAVRDAVVEILASPDLRTLISGPTAARLAPPAEPAPAKPGPWTRFKAKVQAAADAALGRCRAALGMAIGRCRAATAAASTAARTLSAMMPVRKFLAVGAGVGVVAGVVSYACPHAMSAAIGGVGAACTAVGVQVGTWVRRSTGLLGFGRSA
jgi:hypothetical protein